MSKEQKTSWFRRLKAGLSRSSEKFTDGITDLFINQKLDQKTIDELEDLLIMGDLGAATAGKLTRSLAATRFGKEILPEEVKEALAEEVTKILLPVAQPFAIDTSKSPHIILFCGVNGSGKTTTIGKMANQFVSQGHKTMLAAGDTFRAAAIEQLQVWGERVGCPVVAKNSGADAAGLVYEAIERARSENVDVLLIDTAGRLQNKKNLMAELEKVIRVVKKLDADAPHDCLLVLDATVGQNAHSQVEIFRDIVNVTGLIMTKLDGSAKGGVVVALAESFGLPMHAVGVGEGIGDLRPFKAEAFARNLMGLEA